MFLSRNRGERSRATFPLRVLCHFHLPRVRNASCLLQGGEEAAALLSQLEAEPAGDLEYTWNIKVRHAFCGVAKVHAWYSYLKVPLAVWNVLELLERIGQALPYQQALKHCMVWLCRRICCLRCSSPSEWRCPTLGF